VSPPPGRPECGCRRGCGCERGLWLGLRFRER
jgi:hypothetical protein